MAGVTAAIPTAIRRLGLVIPGELLLSRTHVRLANQKYSRRFFHYCQDSFHYDAFLRALRASLAAASLASRLARIVSARPTIIKPSSLPVGLLQSQKARYLRDESTCPHYLGRPPPFPSFPEPDFQQFHTSSRVPAYLSRTTWEIRVYTYVANRFSLIISLPNLSVQNAQKRDDATSEGI